eukprot:751089-Hanusia_phi.AAC.3
MLRIGGQETYGWEDVENLRLIDPQGERGERRSNGALRQSTNSIRSKSPFQYPEPPSNPIKRETEASSSSRRVKSFDDQMLVCPPRGAKEQRKQWSPRCTRGRNVYLDHRSVSWGYSLIRLLEALQGHKFRHDFMQNDSTLDWHEFLRAASCFITSVGS